MNQDDQDDLHNEIHRESTCVARGEPVFHDLDFGAYEREFIKMCERKFLETHERERLTAYEREFLKRMLETPNAPVVARGEHVTLHENHYKPMTVQTFGGRQMGFIEQDGELVKVSDTRNTKRFTTKRKPKRRKPKPKRRKRRRK